MSPAISSTSEVKYSRRDDMATADLRENRSLNLLFFISLENLPTGKTKLALYELEVDFDF
jgi:hypothetical protein